MFSCRASFVNRAGMTAPVQFTRADIVGGTASIRKSDSYCEMNYFSYDCGIEVIYSNLKDCF